MEEKGPPHVIVTSLLLPDIDGWTFTKLLRSPDFSFLNKVPILLLSSASGFPNFYPFSYEIGVDAFLQIPFKNSELRSCMNSLLTGNPVKFKKRIVMLKQDNELSLILKNTLINNDFLVDIAITHNDCLDLVYNFHPQLVFYDYRPYDNDTKELIQNIKKLSPFTIVTIITADPTPALSLQMLKDEVDFYLRKPFDIQQLIELWEKFYHEKSLLQLYKLLEDQTLKLKESEEKFLSLFENSRDAIYFSSKDGSIIDVNQAALNHFGYSRDEMLNMNTRDLFVNPETIEKFQKDIDETKVTSDYEEKLIKKDGTEIVCLISSSVRFDKNGFIIGYQGLIRNITERKKMQSELLKMEKLESVNILAGGIAHDFNNVLTAILGNLSLAKIFAKSDKNIVEKLEEAEKASLPRQKFDPAAPDFLKSGRTH